MAPESKNTMVERFVSSDLTGAELDDFQNQVLTDPSLSKDIELSLEVEQALQEKDILQLRQTLQQISGRDSFATANETANDSDAYFGLADEIERAVNLEVDQPGVDSIGNFLQKLHIYNHASASKETIHELYRNEEVAAELDSELLPEEDEMLFKDIEMAIGERDILDLRSNLQSIAASISHHEFSANDIEEFISGEASDELAALIHNEVVGNESLAAEIELFSEINDAIAEKDILELRASLNNIMGIETSHTRNTEEIDDYLMRDMDEHALALFEDELLSNPGLVASIKLNSEINDAILEDDIMTLRSRLQDISNTEREHDKEKRGFSRAPKRKPYLWYAAASIVLLIALSGILRVNRDSDKQLYATYYQPYSGLSSASRSGGTIDAQAINKAIGNVESGKYDLAIEQLSLILLESPENATAWFYRGLAFQGQNETDQAIESFQKVIQHGDNLFVEQSQWYIGLCYLNNEERDKAVKQFRKIAGEVGYYQAKAQKLLSKID